MFYPSARELGDKLLGLVCGSEDEVGVKVNLEARVGGGNEWLEGPRIVGVGVQSLEEKGERF